jgi:hypothetical protein
MPVWASVHVTWSRLLDIHVVAESAPPRVSREGTSALLRPALMAENQPSSLARPGR